MIESFLLLFALLVGGDDPFGAPPDGVRGSVVYVAKGYLEDDAVREGRGVEMFGGEHSGKGGFLAPVQSRAPAHAPRISDLTDLDIPATSAVALDRNSDKILFQKDAHAKVSIASTTKMMTALVVLESGMSGDERVIVSRHAALTEGSSMRIQEGDELTVKDLLYGLLIASGNDAGVALAEHVGGSVEGFAELMNAKARSLNLHNSHFSNPTGLDQEGNYSSAYDLAQLTDYVLSHDLYREAFTMHEYTAYVLNKEETRKVVSTNRLLGVRGDIIGGKTGYTHEAGRCFIAIAERDGRDIITVVLNAQDRFQETELLVDWIYATYTW
jgi:serine-type D-Ala-D-Ala carboxypeptidase (penicillin-binding protein 5/6)